MAVALEQALRAGELVLLFQPQVTLCSPELGLAALVRWQHDAAAIPEVEQLRSLAEAAAVAEALTDWMLEASCRQAARWRDGGLPRLHVAVPLLSRRQLIWSDLARRLERHLAAAGVMPEELEIEIDEALLLDERRASLQALAALRELGVRVAVGGYGGGPTSLAILRDLPLTTVKLARQLLAEIPDDDDRRAVASGVIRMAGELRLRVVADGVETQAQLQLLRQLGCDAVQALICCPPLPPDACGDWLLQAARRG
jgi:diguanylate cyclase